MTPRRSTGLDTFSAVDECRARSLFINSTGRLRYLVVAGATLVLVYLAQVLPVASTVICAAPSCPLAQAPASAVFSWPSVNETSWIPPALQSSALKWVPLNPTQALTGATRSGRKPLLKLRWTRRAGAPLIVVGVS